MAFQEGNDYKVDNSDSKLFNPRFHNFVLSKKGAKVKDTLLDMNTFNFISDLNTQNYVRSLD